MSDRIYGEARVLKRVQDSTPEDKGVYVNMDAIRELPDEYEAIITEVRFNKDDLKQDFSNVGTDKNPSWMPQPSLMYRIADACGIKGGLVSKCEPIVQETDINPLLCKKLEDTPTIQKRIVGYRSLKQSERQQEDGTFLPSSICIVDFNAFERCLILWANEEMWTEGYTKPNKYENKYDNKWKRQKHFQEVLKFAQKITQTQAHVKTIRELAGLMTGYKTEDLKSGSLVFAKIRRSREVLQLETAARLQAMSQGHSAPAASGLLYAPPGTPVDQTVADEPETVIGQPPGPEKTNREKVIAVFEKYKAEDLIPDADKDRLETMLGWLHDHEDAEKNPKAWPKVIETLKYLDSTVPEFTVEEHGLY